MFLDIMNTFKKKNRFNIIDTFVIVIILALIAGVIFFVLHRGNSIYSDRSEKNITYTVCISGMDEAHLAAFEAGERVLNSSTLNHIGTISDIKAIKHKARTSTATKDAEGEGYTLDLVEYDDVYDVYITVTAKTSLDSRNIAYIDSQRITVGSAIYIRCGNFASPGHITNFVIG